MVQIKKNRSTTAKFRAFAVDGECNFIDTESGELVDIGSVIAKTFGEDTPVDISVTNKVEEELDPGLND